MLREDELGIDRHYRVVHAVADPTRLLILDILTERELCVTDIIKRTGNLPQPNVSKHLRVLFEAGLVHRQKRGREVFYSLDVSVEPFLRALNHLKQRLS